MNVDNDNNVLYGMSIVSMDDVDYYYKNHNVNMFQINASKIRYAQRETSIPSVAVHSSYSINLARPWLESDWFIQQLIAEVEYTHNVKGFCIVLHTGKSLNYSVSSGINHMLSALLHVHDATIMYSDVRIILETPAGQGTELLANLEEFCTFVSRLRSINDDCHNRFGICLDTCHMYASGALDTTDYDIYTTMSVINENVGFDAIKLIHLNNSSEPFNSKLDRHANLDNGHMELESIQKMIDLFAYMNIPMVLETPVAGSEDKDLDTNTDTVGITSDYRILSDTLEL